MNNDGVPIPIIVAALTGAVSLVVLAVNAWVHGRRERNHRLRDIYSKAFSAAVAYEEFPFVVRRRRASNPEDERIRISTELRKVQEDISYYSAWLTTESSHVSEAYDSLIAEMRAFAGAAIREAWETQPMSDDSGMAMPDFGLAVLKPLKERYLSEVATHLASTPRWLRR